MTADPLRQELSHADMEELFRATPERVWKEYLDNGYLLGDAIREEFSYA